MVKEKVRGNLIVISGPSGCGKGTICSKLLKNNPDLFLNVSMTTREPRSGEVDGVNYYFVSKDEFLNENCYNRKFPGCSKRTDKK